MRDYKQDSMEKRELGGGINFGSRAQIFSDAKKGMHVICKAPTGL